MINEGKGANGAQILKPETVEEMWKDQLAGKEPEKINALGRDIPNVRPDLTHVVSPYVRQLAQYAGEDADVAVPLSRLPFTKAGWAITAQLTHDAWPT